MSLDSQNFAIPGLMEIQSPDSDTVLLNSAPAVMNFPSTFKGERWHPLPAIGPITFGDAQPTFPLTRVRMEFYKDRKTGMVFDSEDVPDRTHIILLSAPAAWYFHLPEVSPMLLDPGRWEYNMTVFAEDIPLVGKSIMHGFLPIKKQPNKPDSDNVAQPRLIVPTSVYPFYPTYLP